MYFDNTYVIILHLDDSITDLNFLGSFACDRSDMWFQISCPLWFCTTTSFLSLSMLLWVSKLPEYDGKYYRKSEKLSTVSEQFLKYVFYCSHLSLRNMGWKSASLTVITLFW